jgi:hypothetical protein
MATSVMYFDYTSENLDILREFAHFHTYLVGENTGQVQANNLGHLGTVIWTYWHDNDDFTVALEEVKIGQRSDNPHYDWRFNPEVAEPWLEVFGADGACYVCGESTEGEDCAEVVFGTVHGVCHAECALQAVDGGKAVWA